MDTPEVDRSTAAVVALKAGEHIKSRLDFPTPLRRRLAWTMAVDTLTRIVDRRARGAGDQQPTGAGLPARPRWAAGRGRGGTRPGRNECRADPRGRDRCSTPATGRCWPASVICRPCDPNRFGRSSVRPAPCRDRLSPTRPASARPCSSRARVRPWSRASRADRRPPTRPGARCTWTRIVSAAPWPTPDATWTPKLILIRPSDWAWARRPRPWSIRRPDGSAGTR